MKLSTDASFASCGTSAVSCDYTTDACSVDTSFVSLFTVLSSVVVEAVLPQAVAHRHTASTVPTIFNCFSLIFFLFLRCYLFYRTVVFTCTIFAYENTIFPGTMIICSLLFLF